MSEGIIVLVAGTIVACHSLGINCIARHGGGDSEYSVVEIASSAACTAVRANLEIWVIELIGRTTGVA